MSQCWARISKVGFLALAAWVTAPPALAQSAGPVATASAPVAALSAAVAPNASAPKVASLTPAPNVSDGALPAAAAPAVTGEQAPTVTLADYPLTSIPLDTGLPLVVRGGLYFADVAGIDDKEGNFSATVDLRLRWQDLRLHYDPSLAPMGFKEFRGADADTKLAEIWSPDVRLANLTGDASFQAKGLRLYPDGNAELVVRTSGDFSSAFDLANFPFDRQSLTVELVSQRDTADKVSLEFRQSELDFSKVAPKAEVKGWTLGLVDLARRSQAGWYGQANAKLEVSLTAARHPGGSAAAIFIPLLASLLIPLLAMWLNKLNDDAQFEIEAFELTNIIIGGLFAVIALNFTVNAEYPMLSGDNTVSRLFVLNYVTLGISLLINLLLFRFNLVARYFDKYVQEQLYKYFVWSVPSLVALTAVAVLLNAMV
ncbi:MAG TPA: hypothetical protein VHM70_05170 [Polyangiaceae bacterium]|nr:hypothetical protein [Polyangiaceae bacterium]